MTSRVRTTLAAVGATALIALFGAPAIASTGQQSLTTSAADSPSTSDTQPPSAVEDFAYPNAASILKDKGIKLIKGDGHITLADCDQGSQQIRISTVKGETADQQATYCFQATAKTGYLTLELPHVFYLRAADHPFTASLTPQDPTQGTPAGPTQQVDVAKGGFKSVGEGTAAGTPTTLVEIRVTG
ncbi:hypothetical protein ABZ746_17380 [Streptomyces sp. NPDC020096]|uniref:hypothetical protein n=1 Tax=Streptomyces sp. RPT161 TaxID=3015993 RepID=UPI0022B8D06D|nr:hypothetical protein [Streptomyces sp. RPT161]